MFVAVLTRPWLVRGGEWSLTFARGKDILHLFLALSSFRNLFYNRQFAATADLVFFGESAFSKCLNFSRRLIFHEEKNREINAALMESLVEKKLDPSGRPNSRYRMNRNWDCPNGIFRGKEIGSIRALSSSLI